MWSILILMACGGGEKPVSQPEPPGVKDALVVILDTTRADRVSAGMTPQIWAHAADAWHPVRAYTPSPWTVPSVVSLLTGKAPWECLVPTDRSLPESAVTLPERIDNRRTSMVSANSYVTERNGFSRGFDRFESVESDSEAVALAKRELERKEAAETNAHRTLR